MSRVVCFIDESASTSIVATSAAALARLLGSRLDVVHVGDDDRSEATAPQRLRQYGLELDSRTIRGEPIPVMLGEMGAADTVFAVLGSRSIGSKPEPAGHIALALLAGASIPLLVVPPGASPFPDRPPRLLLPLDGDDETSAAVEPTVRLLDGAGAEIVVLHVFDSSTVPRFIESSDDVGILAREFQERHTSGLCRQCELRIGDPAQEIMAVAEARDSDGIIVAWHQDLSAGHARVVLELLRKAARPLIFAPV